MKKKTILFVCTHNSARSQLAEGLMRSLYGDSFEVSSAGTKPASVNPFAVKAMAEIGIDITGQTSKNVQEFLGIEFDYVVTVCDYAKETCPFFPGGGKYIHKSFRDPAAVIGTDEVKLAAFRMVRDEIKDWLQKTFAKL